MLRKPCTCPYSGSQVVLPVPAPVSSRPPGDGLDIAQRCYKPSRRQYNVFVHMYPHTYVLVGCRTSQFRRIRTEKKTGKRARTVTYGLTLTLSFSHVSHGTGRAPWSHTALMCWSRVWHRLRLLRHFEASTCAA